MTQRDIIFIWIPKNAGSTVYASLRDSLGMINQKYPSKQLITKGVYTFGHQSIQKLVSKGHVSSDYVINSYKFTTVRCPYSRAVSLYCYLKNKSLERLSSRFSASPTFLEYLRILKKRRFLPLGVGKRHWLQMANPQTAWLNEYKLDNIIPIANLKESLIELKQHFNSHNCLIDNRNINPHSDWQHFYCKESKQLVEFLYQQDFDQLQHYDKLDFDVPDHRDYLLKDEYELPFRLRSKLLKFATTSSRIFRTF